MNSDDEFQHRFQLAYHLLENGAAGIQSIVDELSDYSNRYYVDEFKLKNCLATVQNALECLLKVPLAWADWRLVTIEQTSLTKLQMDSGNFKTITFDEACKLLKKPPFNVNISLLKTKHLFELRNNRHKHTHYHLKLSGEECIQLIAHGLNFCIEFYKDHIYNQFYEEIDRFSKVDLELKGIPAYVQLRIASAKKRFPHLIAPLTDYFDCCPVCDQSAPIINSADTVLCLYCKTEDDIRHTAETISTRKHPTRIEPKQCPECLYDSMGAVDLTHNPESWQCVMCGYYTNVPEYFNNVPGGLKKNNIGKPDRRFKIRWTG
jgi:hypothetical protein